METRPVRLYFLCIQNRCRSQIAEAYAKHYGGENVIAESAGLETGDVHPYTIEVMKEVGIDISHEISKTIDMKTFMQSNVIVKLCEQLNEKCPVVPFAIKNVQWNVADPLAQQGRLEEVRAARDEIRLNVIELFRELNIPVNE
ncbi:arsenate reductase ArsC [Paenibacillus monticola]|uniref:Arsenate reductase (Thioredoxin) n=1 Tax=Paenibacillus monticola TaxID=2666075 RepID=A0A7X2L128_9BACL|nr:arsenate reductase ArsC [Paenibacillus monticola]MRN52733.1 arsenate reductase (thioredoxin) [Paenibacillus monticola]